MRFLLALLTCTLAAFGSAHAGSRAPSPAGTTVRAQPAEPRHAAARPVILRHATSRPDCGATIRKPDGTPWICTFDDEFTGSALDTTKWVPATSQITGLGGPACYVDSPANIAEGQGVLRLTARKEAQPFTCNVRTQQVTSQYTAGQVSTAGHFAQTYGRFAVRAKFPAATVQGLQSSLWMWPQHNTTTDRTAEIDIAEEFSRYPDRAIPHVHYAFDPATADPATNTNTVTNTNCLIDDVSAFHEYVVEWTATRLTFRYDGRTCLVDNYVTPLPGGAPFNQPFFVNLTQTLGINTNAYLDGSTPLPATTTIDWVRVWR